MISYAKIQHAEIKMKDLTRGNPTKIILSFMLPVFIGNLFNLAYSLADTRIIGSFLGNDALAAVGSISTLSDLLTGFVIGLSNGFAVVTSRYYGMGKHERVRKVFAAALLLGLGVTAILVIGSLWGLSPIMDWLHIADAHRSASRGYITVLLYGLFFALFYNSLAANLRAIGDAYTPLFFLVLSACLNVGLDMLCVGTLSLGVGGAAAATVLSQFLSAALCFTYTWIKYPFLRFAAREFIPERSLVRQLLPAGFSMGLMNSLVNFGTLALQTSINALGTNIIVAHAATRKLTSVFMMPFSAFGTTMATFCGQNYGARRIDRIKGGLIRTLGMCYLWCVAVMVIAQTICPHLIVAITDTTITEVIETAWLYQRVDTLFYFVVPTITVLRNSLQGIGDHTTPILSSSLELVGKLVFAMVLTPYFGYWAIILAEPVVWIIMVIPLIYSIVTRLKKESHSSLSEEAR